MKQELNIAAILKDKPVGTKLYSPCCGVCTKGGDGSSERPITLCLPNRVIYRLLGNGKEFESGEIMVYPSKEMRDWSKFAWERGDVLQNGDCYSIFVQFDKNTKYTNIITDFLCNLNDNEINWDKGKSSYPTDDWSKVTDEQAKKVISHIEKCLGGKLNLETLEIDKPEPQFKDGDIVVREENIAKSYAKCILIFKAARNTDNRVGCYTFYNDYNKSVNLSNTLCKGEFRLASEEEKQQLFDALTDINKYWNAETKTLEDLPKKCEFKAFDKVVVRHGNDCYWGIDIFSNYGDEYHDEYQCLTDAYEQCLPYNEKTAHLLGTTDDYEE